MFDRERYRIKCAAHNIGEAEDYREGIVVAQIIRVSNGHFILLSRQTQSWVPFWDMVEVTKSAFQIAD